jgi:polyhydroxyalkanoate synthase
MASTMENTTRRKLPKHDEPPLLSNKTARPVAPLPKANHKIEMPSGGAPTDEEQDVTESTRQTLDHIYNSWIGHLTAGVSPASIMGAYADWAWHIAMSPGKQGQLAEKAWRKATHLSAFMPTACSSECKPCIDPLAKDSRFTGEEWQKWPYNIIYQSFLLTQQWWHNATTDISGVSEHHIRVVNFTMRQLLDMFSPSNIPFINPEIIHRTIEERGQNFFNGLMCWLEDLQHYVSKQPHVGAENFIPGESVAVTPGKIIYRNHLIELIQYSPTTSRVQAEPVLIVPACIMKYYILDLSPNNSLVKWLVDQGYTVFMISWKNPDRNDRELGLDDYRKSGIMAALDAVNAIVPDQKVHGVGYCLGGTLLSIATATMDRESDKRLASMTTLASLMDFSEAGELELFIDESQVDFLEDMMWEEGYLDAWQMANTFRFLHSNDLIWSHVIHEYMMGERTPMFDLMAWSMDATRLPYRMHSEYLRQLYLSNELAEENYKVDGSVISLRDIKIPVFAVGTRTDHIAPWKSVYKIHALTDSDVTFVLTNGGHNAGVVNEPGHHGRVYQIADKAADAPYVDPLIWEEEVPQRKGSWWPEWVTWLKEHSSGETSPPAMGAPDKGYSSLYDAPGQYVLQR